MKPEHRGLLRVGIGTAQVVSASLTLSLLAARGTSTATLVMAVVTVSFTIVSRLTFAGDGPPPQSPGA